MSTSLLYNMFGIRGYEHRRSDYHDGATSFVVEQPRAKDRCPECGSAAVHAQGHTDRFLRSLPIGGKPTFIVLPVARVICFRCELTRRVKVRFAEPRRTYTHAFERYALELSRVDDHPGRGPSPRGQLGHHQGHPEAASAPAVRQAEAEATSRRSPSTRSPSARGTAT